MSKLIIPPIDVIENFLEKPTKGWKGNCYCVASRIVDGKIINDNCRAVYGHYLGPISLKSYFKDYRDMPFCNHGWILLSNGDIIDPTRWVFEVKKPYIAYFDRDDDIALEEYDEGGNEWRKSMEIPAPKYRKEDRQFLFTLNEFDKLDGRTYVLSLLGDKRDNVKEICLAQIFWLANLSLKVLGMYVDTIYGYIASIGQDAFIPMDNRLKILGDK